MKKTAPVIIFFLTASMFILKACNEPNEVSASQVNTKVYNAGDFPEINLFIEKEKLAKIDSTRLNALKMNDFSNTRTWFKASVIHNGSSAKAKVRLKGDLQDHYDTDRFSLRLKYKQQKRKVVYSLQHPKTRKYISEWIFHQLLKQEDLNYLGYEFVTLIINGKIKGLYAREEHFTNEGIEKKWNRPKGPILGFDDSGFWAGGLDTVERNLAFDTKAYKRAEIKVYNYKKHESLYQHSMKKLDAYRKGQIPSDSVFNMKMMGKFYALCDLSGATHALRWLNVRYYYHPETKVFEPVGFDSNSNQLENLTYFDNYLNSAHHDRIRKSPTFIHHYKTALQKYRDISFLDSFFSEHQPAIDLYVNTLIKTDSIDCSDHIRYYYENQALIDTSEEWRLLP